MKYSALALYPMMGVIVYSMWQRVRGYTLEDIVEASAQEHHALTDLFYDHPEGGTAAQYDTWMQQAGQRRD